MEFGDFDDDLFGSNSVKETVDLTEQIQNYKAKLVNFKDFLGEKANPNEIDESANLLKLQADYYYFNGNYEKALQNYQQSLEMTTKMKVPAMKTQKFHDKTEIKEKQSLDSIARCLARLSRFQEAIKIADKLISNEQTAQNFEALSTSLNLKMEILTSYRTMNNNEDIEILKDELNTIERLVVLHPYYYKLWIKLGNALYSMISAKSFSDNEFKKHYLVCYFVVSEIYKHGYALRSELVTKQKQRQTDWLANCEMNLKKMNEDWQEILEKKSAFINQEISAKLEKAEKLDDIERQACAKKLENHEQFSQMFFEINF